MFALSVLFQLAGAVVFDAWHSWGASLFGWGAISEVRANAGKVADKGGAIHCFLCIRCSFVSHLTFSSIFIFLCFLT